MDHYRIYEARRPFDLPVVERHAHGLGEQTARALLYPRHGGLGKLRFRRLFLTHGGEPEMIVRRVFRTRRLGNDSRLDAFPHRISKSASALHSGTALGHFRALTVRRATCRGQSSPARSSSCPSMISSKRGNFSMPSFKSALSFSSPASRSTSADSSTRAAITERSLVARSTCAGVISPFSNSNLNAASELPLNRDWRRTQPVRSLARGTSP